MTLYLSYRHNIVMTITLADSENVVPNTVVDISITVILLYCVIMNPKQSLRVIIHSLSF